MLVTAGDLNHLFTRERPFYKSNLRQRPGKLPWTIARLAVPLLFRGNLLLSLNLLRMAQLAMLLHAHGEKSAIIRNSCNVHIANGDFCEDHVFGLKHGW